MRKWRITRRWGREEGRGRSWTRQPPLDSRINLGWLPVLASGHEVFRARPFRNAGTKRAKKRGALSRMDLIKKHNLEGEDNR